MPKSNMTDKIIKFEKAYIERFRKIFEGLDSAYGQTIKTDQFDERGKLKTKSYTVNKVQITKIYLNFF